MTQINIDIPDELKIKLHKEALDLGIKFKIHIKNILDKHSLDD